MPVAVTEEVQKNNAGWVRAIKPLAGMIGNDQPFSADLFKYEGIVAADIAY